MADDTGQGNDVPREEEWTIYLCFDCGSIDELSGQCPGAPARGFHAHEPIARVPVTVVPKDTHVPREALDELAAYMSAEAEEIRNRPLRQRGWIADYNVAKLLDEYAAEVRALYDKGGDRDDG